MFKFLHVTYCRPNNYFVDGVSTEKSENYYPFVPIGNTRLKVNYYYYYYYWKHYRPSFRSIIGYLALPVHHPRNVRTDRTGPI